MLFPKYFWRKSEWEFLWPTTNQKSSIFDNFPHPRSYYFSSFLRTFIFCEIEKKAITVQSSQAFVLEKQFFFIIIVNYLNDIMQRSLWNYLLYFDCSLAQCFSTLFGTRRIFLSEPARLGLVLPLTTQTDNTLLQWGAYSFS